MYAQSLGRWLMRIELDRLAQFTERAIAEHGSDSLMAQLASKTLEHRRRKVLERNLWEYCGVYPEGR